VQPGHPDAVRSYRTFHPLPGELPISDCRISDSALNQHQKIKIAEISSGGIFLCTCPSDCSALKLQAPVPRSSDFLTRSWPEAEAGAGRPHIPPQPILLYASEASVEIDDERHSGADSSVQ